jgi:3-hydroxy-5-phosphonooxypentane-2,4-dione thiolase
LGAHIVKTYYCDNFQNVVSGCPVPVIIAGGKKLSERDALNLASNAIRDGASGVDMGRNIWQSDYPVPMTKAVRSIIHNNYSAEEAYNFFNEQKQNSNKINA